MISIREGSSLHYSLLWIDEQTRERFVDRLNLIQVLATTLEDVQDPNVAHTKIHWWHEELERMVAGNARHPAVQPCQALLCNDLPDSASSSGFETHPAAQACLAILSAVSTTRFNTPENNQDADALLIQSYTARMALLAHALSATAADLVLDSHPSSASLALGKHEQLSRLPQLIHRGQAVFPDDLYQRHQIEPGDLAKHVRVSSDVADEPPTLAGIPVVPDNPNRAALLREVTVAAHAALNLALTDEAVVGRYRRTPLLPLWRLLVLRQKQLALWERVQPDLLRERSTLTPLHKLFWAWRNRR